MSRPEHREHVTLNMAKTRHPELVSGSHFLRREQED